MPFALFTRLEIEMPDNNPIVLKNLLCSYSGHRTQTITIFFTDRQSLFAPMGGSEIYSNSEFLRLQSAINSEIADGLTKLEAASGDSVFGRMVASAKPFGFWVILKI